jgi:hypothetical protein
LKTPCKKFWIRIDAYPGDEALPAEAVDEKNTDVEVKIVGPCSVI